MTSKINRRGLLGLLAGTAAVAAVSPVQALEQMLGHTSVNVWIPPSMHKAMGIQSQSYDPLDGFQDDMLHFSNGVIRSNIVSDTKSGADHVKDILARRENHELFLLPPTLLNETFPALDLFEVPYFSPHTTSTYNLVTSEMFREIFVGSNVMDKNGLVTENQLARDTNTVVLGWVFLGPRVIGIRDQTNLESYQPESFRGMKVATSKTPLITKAWNKLGVQAVESANFETAIALSTAKSVDLVQHTMYGFDILDDGKFPTSFPTIINESSTYMVAPLACSHRWFETLTPTQKYALHRAGRQLTELSYVWYASLKDRVLYNLTNNHEVDMVSISDETREAWEKSIGYRDGDNISDYWYGDLDRIVSGYKFNGFTTEERVKFLEIAMTPSANIVADY